MIAIRTYISNLFVSLSEKIRLGSVCLLAIFISISFHPKVFAQPCTAYLNGTYTVGPGGNYSTLTAAANAFNTSCLSGPVQFILTAATYNSTTETFPIIFNRNTSASSATTLTIKPASGIQAVVSGSVSYGALIRINSSYVTIDGSNNGTGSRNLEFVNTSIVEPRVIYLGSTGTNFLSFCTIKNCVLTNGNADKSGLLISDAATMASPGYFSDINIENNQFRKALYGIYCTALTTATNNGVRLLIANNDLSSTGSNGIAFCGIFLRGINGALIKNNSIGNFIGSDTVSDKGIYLADTVRNTVVYNNRIFNLNNTSGRGFGAHGIYVATGLSNAAISIANNMIANMSGDGNDYNSAQYTLENPCGIMLAGTVAQSGISIYHNSISLGCSTGFTNTLNKSRAVSSCIRLRSGSSADIKNNIMMNNLGLFSSTGYGATGIMVSQAACISSLDYNDYSINPSGSGVKLIGFNVNSAIASSTLSDWRTQSGRDNNSTAVVPVFVSPTDLHLSDVGNTNLNNTGTPIVNYNFDVDSTYRNYLHPDVGCDEFVPANMAIWNGRISNDFGSVSNWDGNILPSGTRDVYVSSEYATTPILHDTLSVRGLVFSGAANSTLLSLDTMSLLQIAGTLTGNGANMDASKSTVNFNGSVSQVIPAGIFKNNKLLNLAIGNSSVGGVTLAGPLDICRSLVFSSTGNKLNTGDLLTLKSTANETAWVGDLTGKTITGKATVERCIPTGMLHGKSWQFIAVPLTGTQTINQAWQDTAISANQNRYSGFGTQITGSAGGSSAAAQALGFDVYTPSGASVKTYNASNGSWDGVASTNATPIANPKGYFVFVRGDRSVITYNAAANVTTLRAKGNLYTASAGETPPVITVGASQFESVGNPYASAIDFRNLTRTGNVDQVFYVWDPLLSGSNGLGGYQLISAANGYRPQPGGTSNYNSAVACPFIQSGQAFFIHANSTSGGTIGFTESAKISGSRITFRNTDFSDAMRLNLQLYGVGGTQTYIADATTVAIENSFNNDVDEFDAAKYFNPGENLYIKKQDNSFGLLSMNNWSVNDSIQIMLSNLRTQPYHFDFNPENWNISGYQVFLKDKFTQAETMISSISTTPYDFAVTNDLASKAADRFVLFLRPISILPMSFILVDATIKNNDIEINWKVAEEQDVKKYKIQFSEDARSFSDLDSVDANHSVLYQLKKTTDFTGKRFYRIIAIAYSGACTISKIVEMTAKVQLPEIKLNATTDGADAVNLQFINCKSGRYHAFLYNTSGQLMERKELVIVGNFEQKCLIFNAHHEKSAYTLKVLHESGDAFSIRCIY